MKVAMVAAAAGLLLASCADAAAPPPDPATSDGPAFEAAADGSVIARVSHMVCPPALAVFRLSGLFTVGAADGSRGAGCRYASGSASLAVLMTPPKPGESLRKVYERAIATPKAASVGKPATWPKPAEGPPGVFGVGSFYNMRDGSVEGIWVTRREDWWFLEVSLRYEPDGEDAVAAAVTAFSNANNAAPETSSSGDSAGR